MDLLRTAPSPLRLPPKSSNVNPPFGSQFWLPIWGHVFMNSICFFLVCVFEPPIWGQVLGPVLGAKIGPQIELAASAAFHVEHRSCSENTHALRGTCQQAINYQQPRVNLGGTLTWSWLPCGFLTSVWARTNVTQRQNLLPN